MLNTADSDQPDASETANETNRLFLDNITTMCCAAIMGRARSTEIKGLREKMIFFKQNYLLKLFPAALFSKTY